MYGNIVVQKKLIHRCRFSSNILYSKSGGILMANNRTVEIEVTGILSVIIENEEFDSKEKTDKFMSA